MRVIDKTHEFIYTSLHVYCTFSFSLSENIIKRGRGGEGGGVTVVVDLKISDIENVILARLFSKKKSRYCRCRRRRQRRCCVVQKFNIF